MNKKFLVIISISLMLLLLLVGCTSKNDISNNESNQTVEQSKNANEKNEQNKKENPDKEEITLNDKKEIITDLSTLPKNIRTAINEIKKERGYTFFELENNEYVIVVSSGEKPTGGYNIELLSIKEKPTGTIEVLVKETSPSKDSVVTQAITYPIVVFKISDVIADFKVENTKGETFAYIFAEQKIIDENTK